MSTFTNRYAEAIHKLVAAGMTQVAAVARVQREQPHLRQELLQQAAEIRGGRQACRSTPPVATTTAKSPHVVVREMVSSAASGEHFSERQIYAACSPIHRTTNWFLNEVARERSHLEASQTQPARATVHSPAPAPVHQPAHQARTIEQSYDHLPFVMPTAQHTFNSLVADAAKCEREYSDKEILQAGLDVPQFRAALATAVVDKISKRAYRVGEIACNCSGPGGVCVCKTH